MTACCFGGNYELLSLQCYGTGVWSGMSPAIRKRSYKRAIRRAFRAGFSFYQGRILTKKGLVQQGVTMERDVSRPAYPTSKHCSTKKGEQARAPRLKCLSWNVGGLDNATYDALLVYLCDENIDIACFQETRWGFTSTWHASGYFCFHSGLPNNSTVKSGEAGGVLTLVKTSLSPLSMLRWCPTVPGRLLQVRIPHRDQHVDIINIYQRFCPSKAVHSEALEAYHGIWQSLDNILGGIPKRNLLILLGDFNASVSSCPPYVGFCTGSSGQTVDVDAELDALVSKHSLCLLNTFSASTELTSVGPRGGGRVIDFVGVRLGHDDHIARAVKFVRRHPLVASGHSSHTLLIASVSTFWRCWKKMSPKMPVRHDIDLFLSDVSTNHPRYHTFLEDLSLRLRNVQADCVDHVLGQVALEHYGRRVHASPTSKLDPAPVRQWWRLWAEFISYKGFSLRKCFKCWRLFGMLRRQQKQHRKQRRANKRARLQAAIEQATQASLAGSQRALHALIRRLSPKSPRLRLQLRGHDGQLIGIEAEQKMMRDHMVSQFSSTNASSLSPCLCETIPFTEEDLKQSFMRIPVRKAAPAACAPSAFVRHAWMILIPVLYRCMLASWPSATAIIPQEWRNSWICWIPKSGKSHTSMSGWRGISLQSVVGKAVLRALTSCATRSCISSLVSYPQFAYLGGRSTGEAILRVKGHIDKALHLGQHAHASHHQLREGATRGPLAGGFQFFMDVEAAFDKVDRTTLMNALAFLDIPDDVRHLIQNWHCGTDYIHQNDSYSVSVEANTGVRQGCVAAPMLWTAFTHTICFVLSLVLSEAWVRENLTLFADDLHACWTFSSENELEFSLVQFRLLIDLLTIMGIRINYEKSVVQLHLRGTRASKWRSKLLRRVNGRWQMRVPPQQAGGEVCWFPVVKQHRYLGVMMSYLRSQDATLGFRIKSAQHTFIRLKTWWSSCLPLSSRFSLWMQIVWPTLTYGLADVGLTKKGLSRFRTLVFRQWRCIAKSPVHLTRESDENLLVRCKMVDPLLRLGLLTLKVWARRLHLLSRATSADILHSVHSLCEMFSSYHSSTHSWFEWCHDQWHRAQDLLLHSDERQLQKLCDPLKDAMPSIRQRLGVYGGNRRRPEASPDQVGQGQPTFSSPPPLPVTDAGVLCPICGRQFANQMAMRQHCRLVHDNSKQTAHFSMIEDAHDGMPTCRHCGMKFRKWQGLIQHIELLVCTQKREGTPVHDRSCPLALRKDLQCLLQNGDWEAILEKAEFKATAVAHCSLCHQWFPRASGLGYHLQWHHSHWYDKGRQWYQNMTGSKMLVRTTPCSWCGLLLSECSLAKHFCPVVVQLGCLLALSSEAADDFAECSSRRDPADIRLNATESADSRGTGDQEAQGSSRVFRRPAGRRRLIRKEGRQVQEGEGQAAGCDHGQLDSQPCTYGDKSRRPHESPEDGHSIHAVLPNRCASSPCLARHYAEMETHEGEQSAKARVAPSHSSSSLCHGGVDYIFIPARRIRGKRSHSCIAGYFCSRRQGHVRRARVECRETGVADGKQAHVSAGSDQAGSHSCPSAVRPHDCDTLSQREAISLRVQRSTSALLSGTGIASSQLESGIRGLDLSVQHDSDRAHSLSFTQTRTTALPLGQGDSAAVKCAWQAWRLNGRSEAVIPSFKNVGNRCYYISVMVALIRCMSMITDHPVAIAWGFLAHIQNIAQSEAIASLEALEPFCTMISSWAEPGRQQDVAEFFQHVGKHIPVLAMLRSEMRLSVAGTVSVEEVSLQAFAACLDFPQSDDAAMISALVRQWHLSDYGVRALISATPVVYLQLNRFFVEAGVAGKRASPLVLEEEFALPVFYPNSIDIEWVRYRVGAYIVHLGADCRSGHYIAIIPCDGGFVIADDDKPCEYLASLSSFLNSNIYVVVLVKA